MSDNGPYTQPPQYPQGGEGNPGGQPSPYGGGYGQPGPGQGAPGAGQPQYPSGPYQNPYGAESGTGGQAPYQTPYGGQPAAGGPQFQAPQEQQMFQGGQPPYGPGGPGPDMSGYPAAAPRKSNAGLWIVIAGGGVILVLVIAVVVMLLRGGGEPAPPAAGTDGGQGATDQSQGSGQEEGTTSVNGEPPYTLPEDPCTALTEETVNEIGLTDPSQSTDSSRAYCSWSVEGEDNSYGTLTVTYEYPYGGSDSVESAQELFQSNIEYNSDEESEFTDLEVHENQELNLGDESRLIFATDKTVGSEYSVGTLLIRDANINVTVQYRMSPDLLEENAPAPLEFSDVEQLLPDLGKQSLNIVG
ncbi:DUF3558 family protein [Marinitenerispora sediminis]|uniref:DUF3558 domain-containing protein n=1 Tax=Marinitenerispora sediminis TaxID=1931232 RepID=A0A368T1D1_9ACTN|nr:DUF3558 family protein [Marinitenerispora sediminis]RCV50233.1 hypothetical protein DEF28_18645 [Marinitenerispora sediminis]RCV53504.1 hypothetical protein DEF24_20505 [Marinitenerispora sediminis]RCV54572.1 hypothetical protein DEF23_15675 [Marinitenerispora sediminis]